MMNDKTGINTIGLIGLGLMGQGIASCLIRYGFHVIAYSRTASREQETMAHIKGSFSKLLDRNILSEAEIEGWEERFRYVDTLEKMGDCQFIIETVGESLELKREIYKTIESVVGNDVVISNKHIGYSYFTAAKRA